MMRLNLFRHSYAAVHHDNCVFLQRTDIFIQRCLRQRKQQIRQYHLGVSDWFLIDNTLCFAETASGLRSVRLRLHRLQLIRVSCLCQNDRRHDDTLSAGACKSQFCLFHSSSPPHLWIISMYMSVYSGFSQRDMSPMITLPSSSSGVIFAALAISMQ